MTKGDGCLTEGRQALAVRLAGIEGGIECERLAPQLSALADGEADAEAGATTNRPKLARAATVSGSAILGTRAAHTSQPFTKNVGSH